MVARIEVSTEADIAKVQCDRARSDQTTLYNVGPPPAPEYEDVIDATTPDPAGTPEQQELDRLLALIDSERGGGLPCP
jgi:hypothetical protein